MKNDEKINDLIKKINVTANEFLTLSNPCAYSDRLVENVIDYAEKLKVLYETNEIDGIGKDGYLVLTHKDSCVGCHSEMGCISFSCKYSQTSCYLCDDCNEELEPSKLRYKDGDMLCFDCLAQRVWEEADKISVSNLIDA